MILINFHLNVDKNSIYFRNISLKEFFKFVGLNSEIQITSFYGYNQTDYFDESKLFNCTSLKDLLLFIKINKITTVDIVYFDADKIHISVSECSEYTFEGVGVSDDYIKNIIAYFAKINLSDKDIISFQCKYLLFKNRALIKTFETFDEYLSSGFAE